MQDTHLVEYVSSRGLALRVDPQAGTVQGVKILGLESQNGRSYTPAAIAAAARLYEGRPVNVDHVEGPRRSYRDRIGRLQKVEVRGDGLYGELIVNPKHPLAEQFLWDAQNAPENVGLSHDAQGRTAARGGRVMVESIQSVRSVDLVAEPATCRGLFEAREGETEEAEGGADESDGQATTDVDRLADDDFALVLSGGVKIGQRTFPLHKRRFPIHDPSAVRRSLARIEANRHLSPDNRQRALRRAGEAAKRFKLELKPSNDAQKESLVKAEDLAALSVEQLKEARPDLVAALASASDAEAQLVRLKEDRDKLAAQLEAQDRRQRITGELEAAKIDIKAVPVSLFEAVQAADDEPRKKLIEDLKTLFKPQSQSQSKSAGPVSSRPAGSLPSTFEDRSAAWSR